MATSTRSTRSTSRTSTRASTRSSSSRRTAQSTKAPPDAIAVLTQDHRNVEALFKTFEGLGPRAHKRRRDTVDRIVAALSQHAAIEETVFYPAVRRAVPAIESDVLEALEEHHVLKWTLAELERLPSEDERFTAKVTVLMENVRHHVKEEEKEMFAHVRKALGRDDLRALGEQLATAKESAPTRPHPRSPDEPPGNLVANALVAPLDVAADLAKGAARRVRSAVS